MVGGEILSYMCFFFSWPDLVLLKFEAHAQTQSKTQGKWSRELWAIHKTTTFLLALTQSDSSSVPVSLHCTDPLLQEHPCSPDSFRKQRQQTNAFSRHQRVRKHFGDAQISPSLASVFPWVSSYRREALARRCTWTKYKSSIDTHTASTKFSPLTQSTAQEDKELSGQWAIYLTSYSRAYTWTGLPLHPKNQQASQARSIGSWSHLYLSTDRRGTSSNTNSYTGDNSRQKSCFLPVNLLSHVWT